jgi:hypothetical protein
VANLIKIKRSAVVGKIPLTTDLELGELAINTADGKLYLKKDDGAETIIELAIDIANRQLFFENDIIADKDYTVTTDKNAMSAGPITLAGGVTITVPAGSTYTVV